jgi:hypothetical protein
LVIVAIVCHMQPNMGKSSYVSITGISTKPQCSSFVFVNELLEIKNKLKIYHLNRANNHSLKNCSFYTKY